MVSGRSAPLVRTPFVSQCADTHSTALGLAIRRAIAAQPRRNSLSSIAFIGDPWPRKSAGVRGFIGERSAAVSIARPVYDEFLPLAREPGPSGGGAPGPPSSRRGGSLCDGRREVL